MQQLVQNNIPTPVPAQPQSNNYSNYDFSNYKSQYSYTPPTFTPIQIDTNNTTEYKSQYATAINEMANQILQMRFSYNPNEDDLLKQASAFATQNTFEAMNSKGILNSSLTAERVARVVGELIPTYEKMAREEFETNFSMLMNTAQFIMNLDDSQYQRWEADRQQKWKEQQFEYQKAQDAIKNAWERVDELGYVDNQASITLGVKVGTLSKDAREAKEQREWEIEEWNRQQQVQQKAERELLLLRQQIEEEQAQRDQQREKELLAIQQQYKSAEAEKEYEREKELTYIKADLSSASSTSSKNTVSLNTYDDVIKNRFAQYDEYTKKYTIPAGYKSTILNYLEEENKAGRLSDNDALTLISKYNLRDVTILTSAANNLLKYM